MANEIEKKVWRFQCDPMQNAEPMVELFMEESATIGDRVFTDQKTTALRVRMIDLFGPPELLNAERVEMLASAPASDRIVPLNHNQPEYIKAAESIDALERAISDSNELTEEERIAIGAEVSGLKSILSASYVYGRKLFILSITTLLGIAKNIKNAVVSSLASDAAHWLIELAKKLIS